VIRNFSENDKNLIALEIFDITPDI